MEKTNTKIFSLYSQASYQLLHLAPLMESSSSQIIVQVPYLLYGDSLFTFSERESLQ